MIYDDTSISTSITNIVNGSPSTISFFDGTSSTFDNIVGIVGTSQ